MKIGSKWGKSNHFLSRGPQASPLGSTHSGRTTGALGMGCVGILKCWGETNIPTSLEQIYRLRLVRNLSSYEGWKLPFGASLNHKKSMAVWTDLFGSVWYESYLLVYWIGTHRFGANANQNSGLQMCRLNHPSLFRHSEGRNVLIKAFQTVNQGPRSPISWPIKKTCHHLSSLQVLFDVLINIILIHFRAPSRIWWCSLNKSFF